MAKMMENIPPEQLAAMSEQMGMPMSVEQARQTKEIMSKVGPERLATLVLCRTLLPSPRLSGGSIAAFLFIVFCPAILR